MNSGAVSRQLSGRWVAIARAQRCAVHTVPRPAALRLFVAASEGAASSAAVRSTGATVARAGGARRFHAAEAAAATEGDEEAEAEERKKPGGGKAVVLSKRLPEDFVENTLLPHLEDQLLSSIQAYTPAELAKISRCYSKQEVRQRALCIKLARQVEDRIKGFEAVDIVDILGPLWTMVPGDDDVFEALEERILVRLEDFTALNLIGIVRIYNKRANKHHELLSKVLPHLVTLLKDYEAVELSEMLMSMAQAKEAEGDMDILMILVPEIERRYSEVSLVHAINNVWALTQMKVVHAGLLGRVAADLADARKAKDLTTAYMTRLAWVYRRCGEAHWDQLKDVLLPLIRSTAAEFRCGDFARLAQALPPAERNLLQKVSDLLRLGLAEMGRKDFLLFLLGNVHGNLLEESEDAVKDPESLVFECLSYAREEQDNFRRDEVQKIVSLLGYSKSYRHLLEAIPQSWEATKEETLDFIRARGAKT